MGGVDVNQRKWLVITGQHPLYAVLAYIIYIYIIYLYIYIYISINIYIYNIYIYIYIYIGNQDELV